MVRFPLPKKRTIRFAPFPIAISQMGPNPVFLLQQLSAASARAPLQPFP